MTTPRFILGSALLTLAVLQLLLLPSHAAAAPLARVLLICVAAFAATQVLLRKRLPGFRLRTRQRIY
jgi:hypothetical protein